MLKSRGTAHSNQVREFVLTDHGVKLINVYVGPDGLLTGSARLAQEIAQRDAKLRQQAEVQRRERELRQRIAQRHEENAADEAEIKRLADSQERLAAEAEAEQRAMGAQRWADPADPDDNDEEQP